MGWDLGRLGVTFEHGAGPRRGNVQAWAGPLLRTCAEGERQHVERRASGVWSSGVWR